MQIRSERSKSRINISTNVKIRRKRGNRLKVIKNKVMLSVIAACNPGHQVAPKGTKKHRCVGVLIDGSNGRVGESRRVVPLEFRGYVRLHD